MALIKCSCQCSSNALYVSTGMIVTVISQRTNDGLLRESLLTLRRMGKRREERAEIRYVREEMVEVDKKEEGRRELTKIERDGESDRVGEEERQ